MAWLSALRAQNFRCFRQLSCELGEGATLFIGDNAQGKTSILEAACVLMRLQSPRTASLAELSLFGESGFGLSGDVVAGKEPNMTRLRFRFQDGKRHLTADAHDGLSPAAYLARSGLIVWMANDDLTLVRGGGEGRRRYLDFLGTQAAPDYRAALLAYDKALRSRNRLLKADRCDPGEFAAYTRPLVAHGTVLTRLRRELVTEVAPWAAEAHLHVSERDESLTLVYRPGTGADFETALAASAAEESRRGMTVVGPHRDDVHVLLNDRPAVSFASEGQQRTIALALKLAQARLLQSLHDQPPILLIDDVFGDLDPHRRNSLLRSLPPAAQTLLTTTHLGWLDGSFQPARSFRVVSGEVTRA